MIRPIPDMGVSSAKWEELLQIEVNGSCQGAEAGGSAPAEEMVRVKWEGGPERVSGDLWLFY